MINSNYYLPGLNQAIVSKRLSGNEPIHSEGHPLDATVMSFWQWSASNLLNNTQRGKLAEYYVAHAMGCDESVRQEWDAFDVETRDGQSIEVKSAAYIQGWNQRAFSRIVFGIQPTYGWNAKTGEYSRERRRQADVYVFCLHRHREVETIDPLNLDQWIFYVLPTETLNSRVGEQKRISLSSLKNLNPEMVAFSGLKQAIITSVNRIVK